MGVPIIQLPADIMATQEIIWATKPDVIVETGVARGGSVLFMADLARKIKLPQVIDFVYITSPKGQSCRIIKDVTVDIAGKHVLIVEEIIDAGRTLSFLKARLLASFPASLKIVTLLDKPALRELQLNPDYVGRTIEDRARWAARRIEISALDEVRQAAVAGHFYIAVRMLELIAGSDRADGRFRR